MKVFILYLISTLSSVRTVLSAPTSAPTTLSNSTSELETGGHLNFPRGTSRYINCYGWIHPPDHMYGKSIPFETIKPALEKVCQKLSQYTMRGLKECQPGHPELDNKMGCQWTAYLEPMTGEGRQANNRFSDASNIEIGGRVESEPGTYRGTFFKVDSYYQPLSKTRIVSKEECKERFNLIAETCSKVVDGKRLAFSGWMPANVEKKQYIQFNLQPYFHVY